MTGQQGPRPRRGPTNGQLTHVTLQTGHSRMSAREEIKLDVVAGVLRPLILRAIAGERVEVPLVEPLCTMTGARQGAACVLTVWGPPDDDSGDPIPVCTLGVAPVACPQLWQMLKRLPLAGGADLVEPPAPWCGAVISVGVAIYPQTTEWLGDFERCVAWTWLEETQLYG